MRDLFEAVFSGDEDAVRRLQLDPREEVYDTAAALCASAVVREAAWVLAHARSERAQDRANTALLALLGHHDSEVRWAVAFGLGGREYPAALEALMLLMVDVDDDVRDWATFGLRTLCKADSPVIREALRVRLADPFEAAREEAIWGLANRRDWECLEFLAGRFERNEWVSGDRDAAAEALGAEELAIEDVAQRLRDLVLAVRL